VLGTGLVLLSAALALVVPGSVLAAGATSLGTVHGIVTTSNGDPVPGVSVGIQALERGFQVTGADGRYSLEEVPFNANGYDVQLLVPCRRDQRKAVVVDGTETTNFTVPANADKDAFGYTCRPATPVYRIGTTVLPLTGDDESTSATLPFPFRFYGIDYTTVNVGTNGFLSFTSVATTFLNTVLPDTAGPNAGVYPFWDDLAVGAGGAVLTATQGSAPNRRFVVEWRDVVLHDQEGETDPVRINFEVVLFENRSIQFNYRDIGVREELRLRGSSATVGIEDHFGTGAFQRSFNQPYLDTGHSIEFVAPK